MEHRINFQAHWLSVSKSGGIKGGVHSGYVILHNELSSEQMEELPAKEIGRPCLEFLKSAKGFKNKNVQKLSVHVVY